eukprot:2440050-Lingulodinium_polyedra.AAC.1
MAMMLSTDWQTGQTTIQACHATRAHHPAADEWLHGSRANMPWTGQTHAQFHSRIFVGPSQPDCS